MKKIWIPNIITILRMIGTLILILYIVFNGLSPRILIAFIVIFLALTDSLDGYLARHFKLTTNLGIILDPVADKVFNWGLALTLMITGYMPWWPLIILVRDIGAVFIARDLSKKKISIQPIMPAKLKMLFQSMGLISTIMFGFGSVGLTLIAPLMILIAIFLTLVELNVIIQKYYIKKA